MKTIVCYDDNPDYGGHQVMACLAIEAMARQKNIRLVFFSNPENSRLNQRLSKIQSGTKLELRSTPFHTQKLQGLKNRFSQKNIHALRTLLEAEHPDLVLCIQGEIEDASLALCAGRRMKAPCISYIPIPHRMTLMGAKLGTLRDQINSYLFRRPDGWITISKSMKSLLEERGTKRPVKVVHNGIDTSHFRPLSKQAARTALGLPENKTLIGTIGRIEFKQKQQDFLSRTFSNHWKNREDMHLVFTGDGPDEMRLKALVKELGIQKKTSFLPWQEESALVYAALDFLIIPSRFEGVPLVMLEALACGTPVLASARDGMKDLLPSSWTFETENGDALASTFEYACRAWKNDIDVLQKKIKSEYTIGAFQENFRNVLLSFLR
ncbi:glycosyltransferase [Tichowtungia aerotolerans]|uniref:Glycosyltransferase n=1 Tax=Tichowtungia aerotolerans TaxID=2697043 RepID=A0A6P1MEU7_9BACT|nr:glycosyltransferase [Tichowtungia aerotolerans]QHI70548.1 glycosyltransferase [Tichowtungia aerotolerans]